MSTIWKSNLIQLPPSPKSPLISNNQLCGLYHPPEVGGLLFGKYLRGKFNSVSSRSKHALCWLFILKFLSHTDEFERTMWQQWVVWCERWKDNIFVCTASMINLSHPSEVIGPSKVRSKVSNYTVDQKNQWVGNKVWPGYWLLSVWRSSHCLKIIFKWIATIWWKIISNVF